MRIVSSCAGLVALAVLAAGCGAGTDAGDADGRTVEVAMVDIAFEPTTITVERGETVRFVFTNKGKVAHDAFVGDAEAQAEHEKQMRGGGGHGHGDEADAVTVDPGRTGELVHTFDRAGTVEIGCHQPAHYQAGMKITVEVR